MNFLFNWIESKPLISIIVKQDRDYVQIEDSDDADPESYSLKKKKKKKARDYFEEAMIQEKKRQEKEEKCYLELKPRKKKSFVMWKNLKEVAYERQFLQRQMGLI